MGSYAPRINHLTDLEEIEKIPLEARFKERTAYDILERAAKTWPHQNALSFLPFGSPLGEPIPYTYQQVLDQVNKTANLLGSCGMKKGDAISYVLPNIPENYFLFLAAQTIGIANPISFRLSREQIADLLRMAGSEILITTGSKTDPQLWEHIQTACTLYQGIKKIIVLEDETDIQRNIYNFYELLLYQPSSYLSQERKSKPEDICTYFHTSGTMGPPKLVQHTHQGVVYIAWAAGLYANYERKNSIVISGLPMFHVAAPIVEALGAFFYGATVVVMSPFGWSDSQIIPHFWKIVEKYKGTSMIAVPPLYKALLKVPLKDADVRSLQCALSGNVSICEEDFIQFKSLTGVSLATLWGQTEAVVGCFNFSSSPKNKNFGSAGIRLPYEQVKIVAVDENGNILRECLPMEAGLLCVKGLNITGYTSRELNKKAFFSSGWFNTGDWAYQNSEGYIWILDRQDDFMAHNGGHISLLEIETLLHQHPKIKKAAALNGPHALSDTILHIYIAIEDETPATLKEVTSYIYEALEARYGAIKVDVEFRDQLPLNGMGKILKYILKEEILGKQDKLNQAHDSKEILQAS